MPNLDSPHADLSRRLTTLIERALQVDDGAAPAVIARDPESAVVSALLASQPLWRARGLRPLLLLGGSPASRDRLKDADLSIRIATADIASLLREQMIAGSIVWCGGAASPNTPATPSAGRTFETLSLTELRAFAMVFQGLWASSRPLQSLSAEREPRRVGRRELAALVR